MTEPIKPFGQRADRSNGSGRLQGRVLGPDGTALVGGDIRVEFAVVGLVETIIRLARAAEVPDDETGWHFQ